LATSLSRLAHSRIDLALVPYGHAMLVPLPRDLDPVAVPGAADNMTNATVAWDDALDALLEPTTKLVISRA
jgi:hypothetical protein